MKYIILIIGLLISAASNAQDWETIRRHYPLAVGDKKICQKHIIDLGENPKSALQLGYLGAYQTIWANHVFNPIAKWSTFKKGKNNLENAIQMDADNIELRWLRLSIQSNIPGFLNYNDHIKEDKYFIKVNHKRIKSAYIQQQIRDSHILD